jgi:glycosyltransferase involved in cell wall biosynthesis
MKKSGFFPGADTSREVVGIAINKALPVKRYDEIDILYVGQLSIHKGVQVLIKAFTGLKQGNVRLHIVGKGPDSDEMKQLAKNDPRIKFYGFISDEDLSELRRKANISVVPSIWYDMAQGVISESFSWGIPVVASDIGGIPEFIQDGYNG